MSQPEAFSRILIDKALEFSGWNLPNPQQIQFEQHTGTGRADYLLKDGVGRVLCVLEAKREGLDPYDAKEQARGYAEQLSAPFIILSNGREHWFWNYERADQRDAYRIERLPSREDLERVRLKNLQPPRPLAPIAGERAGVRGEVSGTATKSVWFYDLTADGYSLDDKRTPIEANDIPDVLVKWPNREEGPNSYRVAIEKIREHDWSLAAGRYKPVTAEPVHHDNPLRIVAEVLALEARIAEKLTRLQGMVK